MHDFILSPEAEDDLAKIYRYIAELVFPGNAARFVANIVDFCEGLRTFPNRGRGRADVAPGLRTIGFHRQVTIIFSVHDEPKLVTIARVIHGRKDVERALKNVR